MKQTAATIFQTSKSFCLQHKKPIIGLIVVMLVAGVALVVVSTRLIGTNEQYILQTGNKKHIRIGMVLGAGITKEGKPFRELQGRLDVAAQALRDGQVDKLILSGDNRFARYNEPEAMRKYMTQTQRVPANKLQVDYAGRSTYESCERAAKVFGARQLIIFSAGSHLPRAIFLCRHFGIEAYGMSSGVEANNSQRRELVARIKAMFNVYLYGEKTIIGPRIPM